MALRGNQFKSNNIRKNAADLPSGAKKVRRTRSSQAEKLPSFDWSASKVGKILGLLCLLFSIYFLVAFTSYLFTWQDDQSYVSASNGGWGNLFKTPEELKVLGIEDAIVENWLGKFGALLAHQFIYKWFGIGSFIFIGILFIVGYRLLFKVRLFILSKLMGYSLFFIFYIYVVR